MRPTSSLQCGRYTVAPTRTRPQRLTAVLALDTAAGKGRARSSSFWSALVCWKWRSPSDCRRNRRVMTTIRGGLTAALPHSLPAPAPSPDTGCQIRLSGNEGASEPLSLFSQQDSQPPPQTRAATPQAPYIPIL